MQILVEERNKRKKENQTSAKLDGVAMHVPSKKKKDTKTSQIIRWRTVLTIKKKDDRVTDFCVTELFCFISFIIQPYCL